MIMNTKSKKLLVVSGGRSIHTYNLIALVRDYFSQTLLLTDFDNEKYPEITKYIVNCSFRNPLKVFQSFISIKRCFKTYKPDFIIYYQIDTAAFLCSFLQPKQIPNLIIAMGSDVLINPQRHFIYRKMVESVINRGNYFNAGSEEMIKTMKQLSKKKIDVVLANLGIEPIEAKEKQNIVFSNRLHKPLYRIEEIIKGFARFLHENPHSDWILVIAATGNEENLQFLAKKLNIEHQIKFVGWLSKEENAYFYSISRIWISLPQSDSIPLSLMEAMSAECIPIVSDLPTMKDFIKNGFNGIVVSDLSSNFIEEALRLDQTASKTHNKTLALSFGSKENNRAKFYKIFDKEFSNGTR
jgi:glycosyltransferase involved in cell wall biosynthesis